VDPANSFTPSCSDFPRGRGAVGDRVLVLFFECRVVLVVVPIRIV